MTVVMDRRIEKHLHAVDAITGRKRIFAFMADKVTELHRTADAVAKRFLWTTFWLHGIRGWL
jgi:hypothetical protein